MMWCFHSSDHEELDRLLRSQSGLRAYGRHGESYLTWFARLSGSPETSVLNTLLNVFIAFIALRRMGKTHTEAWDSLGMYGGDDGISSDVDVSVYTNAAKGMGQTLTIEPVLRGCQGVSFLSRMYSPDVWFGDENSCCDIRRQLCKFHVTVNLPANVTPEMKIQEKIRGFRDSDRHTPIFRDLVQAAERFGIAEKPLVGCEQIVRHGSDCDSSEQYPNAPGEWMLQLLHDQVPEMTGEAVTAFTAMCMRAGSYRDLLNAPLLAMPRPPVPNKNAPAVLDNVVVLGKPTTTVTAEPASKESQTAMRKEMDEALKLPPLRSKERRRARRLAEVCATLPKPPGPPIPTQTLFTPPPCFNPDYAVEFGALASSSLLEPRFNGQLCNGAAETFPQLSHGNAAAAAKLNGNNRSYTNTDDHEGRLERKIHLAHANSQTAITASPPLSPYLLPHRPAMPRSTASTTVTTRTPARASVTTTRTAVRGQRPPRRRVAGAAGNAGARSSRRNRRPGRAVSRGNANALSPAVIDYVNTLRNPFEHGPVRLGWGTFVPTDVFSGIVRGSFTTNADGSFAVFLTPAWDSTAVVFQNTAAHGAASTWTGIGIMPNQASVIASSAEARIVSGGIKVLPQVAATAAPGTLFCGTIPGTSYSSITALTTDQISALYEMKVGYGATGGCALIHPVDPVSFEFQVANLQGFPGGNAFASSLPIIAGTGFPASSTVVWEAVLNIETILGVDSAPCTGTSEISNDSHLPSLFPSIEAMWQRVRQLVPDAASVNEGASVLANAFMAARRVRAAMRPLQSYPGYYDQRAASNRLMIEELN